MSDTEIRFACATCPAASGWMPNASATWEHEHPGAQVAFRERPRHDEAPPTHEG